MIDIFVEETMSNKVKVYFVQLGCIYESSLSGLKVLCDNIVNLYIDSNSLGDSDIEFEYLPVNVYYPLYKTNAVELFTEEVKENIHYMVKKVC